MPAEQTPMAQKPVMMRGRRPSLSMVKHCQERAETHRGAPRWTGPPLSPRPSWRWEDAPGGIWGSGATAAQSCRVGAGPGAVPGVSIHGAGEGSHKAPPERRVGAGWGDPEAALAPVPGGGAGLGTGCFWSSGHSRVWAGRAAAVGAGRVLTAEQMPVIL